MLCLLVNPNRKDLICVALGICAESGMEKPNALTVLFVVELPRSCSDLSNYWKKIKRAALASNFGVDDMVAVWKREVGVYA
ncbi:hypothetical protein AV530_011835 [Patagioenas fasciata monilis]|uniref:Uncharacterized protein n=1 Tax=Patagioenas fasciata monilis TaxID=372326 RepID=A0A1V4JTU5_PATFA|nr:hypothetical protein AV530_011835 [Patagioenas fasciata monilis]